MAASDLEKPYRLSAGGVSNGRGIHNIKKTGYLRVLQCPITKTSEIYHTTPLVYTLTKNNIQ